YDAASRLQEEQYNTLTPLYHKLHYNVRGQLYDMRLSTQSLQMSEFDGDRGALINYFSNQNFTAGYSGTDNNGNITQQEMYIADGQTFASNFSPIYDAENRLSEVDQTVPHAHPPPIIYTYDADGHRVRRLTGQQTWQVYGIDGELLAEYQAGIRNTFGPTLTQLGAEPFMPQKEYGYRNGQLLITASNG